MAIKIPTRNYENGEMPTTSEFEYASGKIEDSPTIDGGVSTGDAVYQNAGTWEVSVDFNATAIYDGTNPVPSRQIATLTGLTAYSKYYIHASGSISTVVSPMQAGIALSTTALWVNIKPSHEESIRAITGTTHTLDLDDNGYTLECTNARTQTITIPLNSSVAFPIGTWIGFEQHGAGTVTLAGAGGVTVNADSLSTTAQYKTGFATKTGTNEWLAVMT